MKSPFKEDECQKAQIRYLESRRGTVRDVMFCSIPNAAQFITSRGKQNFRLAQYLRDTGLVPGAPDLVVWQRGRILHIENKVKGRTTTPVQDAFGDGLKALGHEYHVIAAETPADAVDKLAALLDWREGNKAALRAEKGRAVA